MHFFSYGSNTISVFSALPPTVEESNYVKASRRPLCTHLCDHYALLITLPSRQEVVDEGKGDDQCPHHKLRLKLRAAAKPPRSMFSRGSKLKSICAACVVHIS